MNIDGDPNYDSDLGSGELPEMWISESIPVPEGYRGPPPPPDVGWGCGDLFSSDDPWWDDSSGAWSSGERGGREAGARQAAARPPHPSPPRSYASSGSSSDEDNRNPYNLSLAVFLGLERGQRRATDAEDCAEMVALAPEGTEAAKKPLTMACLPDDFSSCEPLSTSISCLDRGNYYLARENPVFRAHSRQFSALESRLDRVAHGLQQRDQAVGHLREREDLLGVVHFAAEVGAQQLVTGDYNLGLDILRAVDADILDVISRPVLFSRWWETTSKGAHLLAGAFAGITGGAIKIKPAPQYRSEWELGRALGAAAGLAADAAAFIGAAALAAGSGGMAAPVTLAALVPVTRRLAAVASVAAGTGAVAMALHERQLPNNRRQAFLNE